MRWWFNWEVVIGIGTDDRIISRNDDSDDDKKRNELQSTNTMSSFFFSTPVDIDIVLDDSDERPSVDMKLDKNRKEKAPLYMDGESVKGAVTVRPKDGKRLEHTGIKVQFTGVIGMPCLKSPLRWNLHFYEVC